MLIQYIGYDTSIKLDNIIASGMASPQSLDEFDINVIDLSNKFLWYNKGNDCNSFNSMTDIKNLNKMIFNSKTSKIVVIYPQNCTFNYCYSPTGNKYHYTKELKNMLEPIRKSIMQYLMNETTSELIYENTKTNIKGKEYEASFYFDSDTALTRSLKSNKPTTIEFGKLILTTIKITTSTDLIDFLEQINLINENAEIPEWVQEVNWFNDEKIKHEIDEKKELIRSAQSYIIEAQYGLDENNKYKSILYTNGDELVNVVFEILEKIFNYDLSKFVDEKKEDFVIKNEDVTFIGEIKGINTNIKSGNISQLDVHLHDYLENPDTAEDEKVKSLLIINHQRNKPLTERESVHETQIKLAERNGSLIIETSSLLLIFEKFKKGELKTKEIKQMFIKKTGLLE